MTSFQVLKAKLTRIRTSDTNRKKNELIKFEKDVKTIIMGEELNFFERELLFHDLADIYIELNFLSKLDSFIETIKDNDLDKEFSCNEYIELMNHFMEFREIIHGILDEKEYSINENNKNSSYTKGKQLENAMINFFRVVQAEIIKSNLKTDDMEIDIVINFRKPLALEFIKTDIAFVECKNWNKKVGTSEVRSLHSKLIEENYDTGFMIAMNGITGSSEYAAKKLIKSLKNCRCPVLIIPIFGNDLLDFSNEKISWNELITKCYYRVITGEF